MDAEITDPTTLEWTRIGDLVEAGQTQHAIAWAAELVKGRKMGPPMCLRKEAMRVLKLLAPYVEQWQRDREAGRA